MKKKVSRTTRGLGKRLAAELGEATLRKTAEIGLRQAEANLPYIERTIADLDLSSVDRRAAVAIAAGPSLHRTNTAPRIVASGFRGAVVATDGSLGYCLRNGLVPDFVVSLDPHPTRVIRWFGDPALASRPDDDYFRRQDLDPHLSTEEAIRNRELLDLIDRHGKNMRAILCTSVAPELTRRVLDTGMTIYWWNPIFDDFEDPKSYTRRVFDLTKVPCMVAGGNCGTAAWVFAGSVLKIKHVAVVGLDLSYHPDLPLENTQYYTELRELFGDAFGKAFIRVRNPYLRQTWYTDPTYWWYRQGFLSLAKRAPFNTYNCTEGGIVFGEPVRWCTWEDFVKKHSRTVRER